MKKSVLVVFGLASLLGCSQIFPCQAQIAIRGGRGLLRVQDGEIAEKGDLYLGAFGSTFLKKSTSPNQLLKDYHLTLNATYGLSRVLEIFTRFVAYQDDQVHIWGPIGDTEIGMKLKLSLGKQRVFHLGLYNYFILPTAVKHNLQFEPFTADKVGWSPGLALSMDLQNSFIMPLKLYVNGGYIDRNIRDDLINSKMDQVYFGAGLKVLFKQTIFFWEYYTEQFFNRRDEVAFKENYQVSSQGIMFLGPANLMLTIAGDINLAKPTNATFFVPKELSDWKIWVGVSKHIPLKRIFRESAQRRRRERELAEERRKQELIKKQRTEAKDELKRMQEQLKKQKKNKENQP